MDENQIEDQIEQASDQIEQASDQAVAATEATHEPAPTPEPAPAPAAAPAPKAKPKPKPKTKINILLVVAFIIGAAYLIYSAVYWGGATSNVNDAESLGGALAAAIVMPHLTVSGLAVLFNVLGIALKKAGFALVAAILYTVAILLFPMYFMFVVVEAVLCYIAYAQMKKAAS